MTCSVCGYKVVTTLEATGHKYDSWIETSKATCTENGVKTRTCSVCGNTETAVIAAHDHTYSTDYVYDTSTHWQYCTVCGIKHNEANHTKNTNNVCSTCGYKYPTQSSATDSSGFMFALDDNGESYAIIDIGTFSGTSAVLPTTYNGKPVTSFTNTVFSGNTAIESVIIPDSYTSLPASAFSGCYALKSVSLSNNITSIPDYAFQQCKALTDIVLPNELISIGDLAFYNCDSLKEINLPNTVNSIGSSAFLSCSSLSKIVIPNGVSEIEYSSFENCKSLESVILEGNIRGIYSHAFSYCSSLKSIILPESVYFISAYAFDNCTSLTDVFFNNTKSWNVGGSKVYSEQLENSQTAAKFLTLTYLSSEWNASILYYYFNFDYENFYTVDLSYREYFTGTSLEIKDTCNNLPVKRIYYSAFYECTTLKSIIIPKSITEIKDSAFGGCTNLTDIYYKGTEAEWDTINKKFPEIPSTTTIHYNYVG